MDKQTQINLIAGRIIDEHRKHSLRMPDEWHLIAASKIYSQWSEYYQTNESITIEMLKQQINNMDSEIARLKEFEFMYNGLNK